MTKFALGLLISFTAAGAASGQNVGVILVNAHDEHTSCIAQPQPTLESTTCDSPANLRLGRTVRLLVLNRHFLTNYVLDTGAGVNLAEIRHLGGPFGPIPFQSGAPVVEVRSGTIDRKTSDDFLGELLDVTTSSEALAEIEREDQILNAEFLRVTMDIRAFNEKYKLIVGDGSNLSCDPKQSQRNGTWLEACLHGEFDFAQANVQSEKAFRALTSSADTLFEQTRNFAHELAAADMASQGREIESATGIYESDLRSFQWNLNAAQDAVFVVKQLICPPPACTPREPLLSLQIREHLRRQLRAEGEGFASSKPALDDAEINEQIDRYFDLLQNADSIPQVWCKKLGERIAQLQETNGDAQVPQHLTPLNSALTDIRDKVDGRLPVLISEINDWQIRLAARVNEIYENSEVPVTETDFGLNGISSNAVVSYRIVRVSEFEPYVFREGNPAQAAPSGLEVSRGAFALNGPGNRPKKTIWQILRLTH